MNIEDLQSKATIKVVSLTDLDISSCSTDDTVNLSDILDCPDWVCNRPDDIVVLTFAYEEKAIVLLKKKGNL